MWLALIQADIRHQTSLHINYPYYLVSFCRLVVSLLVYRVRFAARKWLGNNVHKGLLSFVDVGLLTYKYWTACGLCTG